MGSKQKILGGIGAFLLTFAAGGQAWAAEYYMSPDGNDSNPGTQAAPWKTLDRLQKAQSSLRPGDTVWFHGGNYIVGNDRARSYYSWVAAGTAANPIVYKNYPGETPVILVTATAPRAGSGTLFILNSYITVDGLSVKRTEESRKLSQAPNGDIISGSGLPGQAFATWQTGVTFRNCSIENFSLGIGYYSGASNILVEHCRIIESISHSFYIAGNNGTYRYNFTNNSRGYSNNRGVQLQYETSFGNKIYGNLFMNGPASGMTLSGGLSNNEIFNNVFIRRPQNPERKLGDEENPESSFPCFSMVVLMR